MQLEAVCGRLEALSSALGRSLQVLEHRRTAPRNYLMPQSAAQGSFGQKLSCPSVLSALGLSLIHISEPTRLALI
eukprot:6040583-Alexandrium_andersonii.AAC.1